jgi:hypothetical protein
MGQNINMGVQYFNDVLFVEAEIEYAAFVWEITLKKQNIVFIP